MTATAEVKVETVGADEVSKAINALATALEGWQYRVDGGTWQPVRATLTFRCRPGGIDIEQAPEPIEVDSRVGRGVYFPETVLEEEGE